MNCLKNLTFHLKSGFCLTFSNKRFITGGSFGAYFVGLLFYKQVTPTELFLNLAAPLGAPCL
jgi:hypothetical protein